MSKLAKFAQAVEQHVKGNPEEAALKMSQALGSKEMLAPVRHSIDSLVKPSAAISDALLKMMKEDPGDNE